MTPGGGFNVQMTYTQQRRVVITGLGAICDLGCDVATVWDGLCNGVSGIGLLNAFDQDPTWSVRIAGQAKCFDPLEYLPKSEAKRMDRFCAMALASAVEAAASTGIDFEKGDPYSRGVAIGSGVGGIITVAEGMTKILKGGGSATRLSPFTVPKLMVNAAAGNVSIRFNLRGANTSPATACATGGHAIGEAYHCISRGDAELMFAGGAEAAITEICVGAFSAMKALSTRNDDPQRASRPFDRQRDGFVLAEGAAVVVLEELEAAKARGAQIYAEVLGFGCTGDAHHIAAPDPEGTGALKAMEKAIGGSRIDLKDIDYINAHGTSTPLGDAAEVHAVKNLFGSHASKLAMSSTKSMTGHMLGAAGGIETLAVALSLQNGLMLPTINCDNPDEGFDLNFVPHEVQERPIRYALNNSFGFGGHNVSLVMGRYEGD